MRRILFGFCILGCGLEQSLLAQPFSVNDINPALEIYMYGGAFSTDPTRIPVWAYYHPESSVDMRMSQSIIGWQTAALIPTNQTPTHYLIKRCRVTLTVNDHNSFYFDPTHDAYQTHLDTNHPNYQSDTDIGRPVELFGVEYRNGKNASSFSQDPTFGSGAPGGRNAYTAGWGTNGGFVDVSNNFGKTNSNFPFFEAWPFAVGQVTNVSAGQRVPSASKMFFELDVTDPAVVTYLQRSLDIGILNFAVSTLYPVTGYSGPGGTVTYPSFTTHFNTLAPTPTRLELEATVIRDLETDADGLPDDWEQFYFGNLGQDGSNDSDGDGSGNLDEFRAGTDPLKSNSAFYVTMPNTHTLSWPNLPSRQSIVQFSDDLLNWQTVTNPAIIFPTPATATWTDTNAIPGNRFYRIQTTTP